MADGFTFVLFNISLFTMETNDTEKLDWFDELSEEQQKSILRGLEEADKGEVIPHNEALIMLGLNSTK